MSFGTFPTGPKNPGLIASSRKKQLTVNNGGQHLQKSRRWIGALSLLRLFKMTETQRRLNSAQADGMCSHGGKKKKEKKKEKNDAEVSAEEVETNFSGQHKPPA